MLSMKGSRRRPAATLALAPGAASSSLDDRRPIVEARISPRPDDVFVEATSPAPPGVGTLGLPRVASRRIRPESEPAIEP